jgi:hypothetical protein
MEKQSVVTEETKRCPKCEQEKPVTEFYRRKARGPNGRQTDCKKCTNAGRWKNGRFRDEAHKQQVLAANRASYARHRSKYAARIKARRMERKAKAIAVLGDPICVRCNQEWHPVALDFHHLDPTTKRFNITDALGEQGKYPWEEIVVEIRKCELICANHHRMEHWS